MLKFLKSGTLFTCKYLGLFRLMAASPWRQKRLLILCYHGLSLKDEHEWRPLFIAPKFFRRRMEILARGRYNVLPLNLAIELLEAGTLPPKSVVITFDDGFHDFYQEGLPVLRHFEFPATVYQTTYYSDHPFPVFNLVLSYLFWRARGRSLSGSEFEIPNDFSLSTESDREDAVKAIREFARDRKYTPDQKDELAARIAGQLGVDYAEIRRRRMLQLMSAAEIGEISSQGIDIQLHTHRHRVPFDEKLFMREIRDNREWISLKTATRASHFCYPSGVYREEFLPWLRTEHVVSATTCESGFASRRCESLLLPRFLDTMNVTEIDFEGWLTGVSSLLSRHRLSTPDPV
jgi:peptidoglycan/xylan/chitin deacetylase (PgdA/CDA1 family)